MNTMIQYRDESFRDSLALEVAKRVDDIFAQGWNGVAQRTATVQVLVRNVLDRALTGATK